MRYLLLASSATGISVNTDRPPAVKVQVPGDGQLEADVSVLESEGEDGAAEEKPVGKEAAAGASGSTAKSAGGASGEEAQANPEKDSDYAGNDTEEVPLSWKAPRPLPEAQKKLWDIDWYMADEDGLPSDTPVWNYPGMDTSLATNSTAGYIFGPRDTIIEEDNEAANAFMDFCPMVDHETEKNMTADAIAKAKARAAKGAIPCKFGVISSANLWNMFWLLTWPADADPNHPKRVLADPTAGFPKWLLPSVMADLGTNTSFLRDVRPYQKYYRAWRPLKGEKFQVADAIKYGELAPHSKPRPEHINYLARPDQDRNYLLWVPIHEDKKDKNANNLYRNLGNDVVFLVDSRPEPYTSKIVMPIYPLSGNNKASMNAKVKSFGSWFCAGHGTVDAKTNMYIGQDANKTHTYQFFRETPESMCSVLPHHAGVLKKYEKKAFFGHYRDFKVVLDFSVIARAMEGRPINDGTVTYGYMQSIMIKAAKSAAEQFRASGVQSGASGVAPFTLLVAAASALVLAFF